MTLTETGPKAHAAGPATPSLLAPPRAGLYKVVYADPPWPFRTYSAKGKGRSAEAHYDCMSVEQIAALPVAGWAAPDAAVLLWVTRPLLERAFGVIRAWGFAYKSYAFTWAKLNPRRGFPIGSEADFAMGCGYHTRANAELCLLATRGRPRRLSRGVRELIVAPRREHSRKPEEAYGRIEALYEGPFLELFGRATRPGWDAWGAQAGLFDHGPVRTRRWPSARPEAAT